MSAYVSMDCSRCKACGACVRECARHLPVSWSAGPKTGGVDCVRCFHCFAVCPGRAIRVEGLGPCVLQRWELPMEGEIDSISDKQLLQFLAYRRSVRKFQNRIVEAATIEKLISPLFLSDGQLHV